MAFFDALNANVVAPKYLRMSELPLFVPLKIMNVVPAVTVIGTTTKIEALLGNMNVFFFLSATEHDKIVENNGVVQLMAMVNAHENPFCFAVKKPSRIALAYAPFSVDLVTKCNNKSRVTFSQIHPAFQNEIDFAELAQLGIELEH